MKRTVRISAAKRRAFTLLEVLMVVVIIGILAALVVPNFFGAQQGAQIDTTRAQVKTGLNGALDLYRMHMNRYPSSDEGLMALTQPPDDEELAEKWRGPYVKDASNMKDAWGNEFIYVSPGEFNESTYDLSSAGPDGQEGTEDDIANWERT